MVSTSRVVCSTKPSPSTRCVFDLFKELIVINITSPQVYVFVEGPYCDKHARTLGYRLPYMAHSLPAIKAQFPHNRSTLKALLREGYLIFGHNIGPAQGLRIIPTVFDQMMDSLLAVQL